MRIIEIYAALVLKARRLTSPAEKCDAIARGEAFVSFPGRLKPTYKRRSVQPGLAWLRSAPAWHGRIQNSSSAHSSGRTGREGRKLSLETSRSFFLLVSLLSLRAAVPSSLTSLSVPCSPTPPLSLSLSLSLPRAFFLSLRPRLSLSLAALHALSRPSSGFHRFRGCTWARRSIFQAVAHEKRSSWGRVPPRYHGWRRRRRRRQTKPGVTSPSVYTKNAGEETESSGIISGGDAGASNERCLFYSAARSPSESIRSRDERARPNGRE